MTDFFSRLFLSRARIGGLVRSLPAVAPLAFFLLVILVTTPPARAEHPNILLVADPDMQSPIFRHSVVLVTPHDNGSAMGIILNHPVMLEAGHLFPGDELLDDAGPIHFGGPVNPSMLVFLFRSSSRPEGAVHLFADVYFSNDRDVLADQLHRPAEKSALQLYVGYAGWAPGQLQAEIMHGGWSVVLANEELVFETDRDSIWHQLSRRQRDKSI